MRTVGAQYPGGVVPAIWAATRRAVLRGAQLRTTRRRERLARFISQLERSDAGLLAAQRRLAEELGEDSTDGGGEAPATETVSADGLDSGIDGETTVPVPPQAPSESPTTVPPEPGTPTAGGGTGTSAAPSTGDPDHRLLFRIFDNLKEDAFTEDFYPRSAAVNERLDEEGEPRVHRERMRVLFDLYLHDRIEEGRIQPPKRTVGDTPAEEEGEEEKQPVTDEVLFEAFRSLGDSDFTKDAPHYPLVNEVRDRIPDGYEQPTREQVRAAWDRFEER